MRMHGFRYRDEWLPNFYPSRAIEGMHFRASRVGSFILLTEEEDAALLDIRMPTDLFERLERTGHILTPSNSGQVLDKLATWHKKAYDGPELHIVVLTKRCNLNCNYCHMFPEEPKSSPSAFDLSEQTAQHIVSFIMGSPASQIMIEFQGGEPFLNFVGMQAVVEMARAQAATSGKQVDFSVVSNLLAVKEHQLDYCRSNGISVSYSLSGPRDIHDLHRKNRAGRGSFDQVMERITQINLSHPGLLSSSPLCVVDSETSRRLPEIIDFFDEVGYRSVAILRLRRLGKARRDSLTFDFQEYLEHYFAALDYLLDKAKKTGRDFSERMIRVAIAKLFSETDVGFVDWRNPCGDFGMTITYDFDGTILPSDEARSLRDRFALGNVTDTDYQSLVAQPRSFETMTLSLRDRDATCRECAYNPFCGVAPILDFARTGSATPVPGESEECLFTIAAYDWIVAKLVQDPVSVVAMLPGAAQWAQQSLEPQHSDAPAPVHSA